MVLALILWLSGNALAHKKAFLVLDVYGKAFTAAERDPLAPIEQDLAKGRDPEIPTGFSHLITETFPLKPEPQPFGVLDETIEDQLLNLGFIAASSGDGQWILSEYRGNIRDKNSEAVEKSNGILVKAQEAIELEKKKMFAEARTEIARLVVATTQRVLAKELSEADRTRYNESASRELTNV